MFEQERFLNIPVKELIAKGIAIAAEDYKKKVLVKC